MKKKIILFALAGSVLALASCTKSGTTTSGSNDVTTTKTSDVTTTSSNVVDTTTLTETTSVSTQKEDPVIANYTVTVKDIDGEVLIDSLKLSTLEGSNSIVSDIENAGYEVRGEDSDYGFFVKSIAGSVIDSNYYLAFNVNGEPAEVGASSYEVKDGDVIEFEVQCFNTVDYGGQLDETDILVDKIIYSYLKNQLPNCIKNDTTYASSDYWTYMTINALTANLYDFSYDQSIIKADLKDSIENADLSTLSGANYGKYYWTAKALGYDLSSFKEVYQEHINSISTEYKQYVTPFEVAPAYGLGVTSENLTTLIKDAQMASTQFGIDALAWQVASLAPYNKYNYTMVNFLNTRSESNCTSNALQLIGFAALNVNPRESDYEVEGVDLVEYIIDNFYDETTNLVKVYKTDEGTNMSTNQVYAGLVSYKIQRDKQKAFYLFA